MLFGGSFKFGQQGGLLRIFFELIKQRLHGGAERRFIHFDNFAAHGFGLRAGVGVDLVPQFLLIRFGSFRRLDQDLLLIRRQFVPGFTGDNEEIRDGGMFIF